MLYTEGALLSNLLHPKFRGRNLTCEQRSKCLQGLSKFCASLDVIAVPKVPTVDEVAQFTSETGEFKDSNVECHPFNFWNSLYGASTDGPLVQGKPICHG